MTYKFLPNKFAAERFNLRASEYTGMGMTQLFQKILGEDNYSRYMIAQDPLVGEKAEGKVSIILNREETDPQKFQYQSIGIIRKFEQ